VLPDMQIRYARRVGKGHLKLTVSDGLGASLDAILFSAFDGPLGSALEDHKGARFHLAGKLDVNFWQGRSTVQMRLDDAAPASVQG
jgi:single-stranded-DNA-specific exonuclease